MTKISRDSVLQETLKFLSYRVTFFFVAAREIVDAVKNSKNLKVLVLEGNTMGVEAAKLIGEALGKHKEFEVCCF